MKRIEIYEPALCCSTGVCGPSVDQELIRITAVAKAAKESGVARIIRRNLGQNPDAFVRNDLVKGKISTDGTDALPITFVDGEFFCQGRYPTNEEIERLTDVQLTNI